MARRIQKVGLRGAIFFSFSLVLLFILASLFFLVPAQVESHLIQDLTGQGEQLAKEVLPHVSPDLDRATNSRAIQDALSEQKGNVSFVALIDEKGTILGSSSASEPARGRAFIQDFLDAGAPVPVRGTLNGGEPAVAKRVGSGYLLVVMDHHPVTLLLTGIRRTLLIALLIGCGLYMVLVWAVSRFFILRPLNSMLEVASKLSESDLTFRVEAAPSDELGTLSEALNRIGQSLRETLSRVRGVSEGVAQVIEQLSRTGTTVTAGAQTVLSRVEETSASMGDMMASLRGIAENVEVLYQSAEESSSSIMEMAATNDEVAENVHAMAASVEETTDAIKHMAFSIKEVAKNIEDLYTTSEETSSSMRGMDVSIGQVEMNANETAKLSEQVSNDAETGVLALQKTLAGIDKIKDTSRTASNVIESLGKRIQEIGNILNVIDDVAEQTNLLALNAAIIAAQAGEHGKGFAVVAEEIKDLAERTGASTKEIADLVRSVQDESRNAVVVMNQGVRSVDEGVQLGREAEGALKKIHESANKSTTMVKAIARATVEQARGSKQVTGAIQRIADTVQEISKASNEQAKGSEQIMKSAERMKTITQHVQRSAQEQAHGSKQITRSIENINEMVTHLNRAQKEQTKGSEQVMKAVDQIKTVSEHQSRSVRQLEEAIEALQQQAEILKAEARRFKV
ncbi:MAG: methyl-accepting chemotaxis protein [Myxococcaceae bacterium]